MKTPDTVTRAAARRATKARNQARQLKRSAAALWLSMPRAQKFAPVTYPRMH